MGTQDPANPVQPTSPTSPVPDPAAPAAVPTPPAPDPATAADDGKGGKDAVLADLAKERDKRQAIEQQLADATAAQQKQMDAIATALGLKANETDPAEMAAALAESQKVAAENAAALTRFQVAVERAVPSHLVEFITGNTREEVESSIAKVLAAFKASAPSGPAPDPSQGTQGVPTSLDARIAEATAAGNTREAIRLKAAKGMQNNTTT